MKGGDVAILVVGIFTLLLFLAMGGLMSVLGILLGLYAVYKVFTMDRVDVEMCQVHGKRRIIHAVDGHVVQECPGCEPHGP